MNDVSYAALLFLIKADMGMSDYNLWVSKHLDITLTTEQQAAKLRLIIETYYLEYQTRFGVLYSMYTLLCDPGLEQSETEILASVSTKGQYVLWVNKRDSFLERHTTQRSDLVYLNDIIASTGEPNFKMGDFSESYLSTNELIRRENRN